MAIVLKILASWCMAASLTMLLVACSDSSSAPQSKSFSSASLVVDDARNPQIGVDADGNMIAAWGGASGIYANRYSVLSGWGSPQKISNEDWTGKLSVSANGDAVALGSHYEPGNSHVEAVRYSAASGWLTPENVGDIGVPKDVFYAATGNIFAVTECTIPPFNRIGWTHYVPGAGWTALRFLDTGTASAGFPKVSADSSGNALVLWAERASSSQDIYVRRFTSREGWTAPEQIASNTGMAAWTNVVFGNNGSAMAIWGQADGSSRYHTFACNYRPGTGWGTVERIDSSLFDSIDQSLAVDPTGNYFAVWTQTRDTTASDIYFSRFDSAGGWRPAEIIGTGGSARYPKVGADNAGNALATWQQYDATGAYPADAKVYANRYAAGTGWSTQMQLKNALGSADMPELAMDSNGRAMVMWSQCIGYTSPGSGVIKYGIFSSLFQ